MRRRQFLVSSCSALISGQPLWAALSLQTRRSADEQLKALLDQFFYEQLRQRPELATQLGLDVGANSDLRSQLSPASRASRGRWIEAERSRLLRLRAFPGGGLSTVGRSDREAVLWRLERVVEGGTRFQFGEAASGSAPYSPYAVSQLGGPWRSIPDFLDRFHPIETVSDAEAYLDRLGNFARLIDDSTEAVEIDAAQGIVAPDFALNGIMAQLRKQRSAPARSNGLVQSLAKRASAARLVGEWSDRAAAIVERQVYPALDRQLEAVTRLQANASADAGVWKLPNGQDYYAGALRFQTTTSLSADELHRQGVAQVAEFESKLDPLLKAAALSKGTVGERLAVLSARPDQLFPNNEAGREAILAYLAKRLADLRPLMPSAFRVLPSVPIGIVRVPPEIEEGSPLGYASQQRLDGSRPAHFYINLRSTLDWPRFTLPTLAFHEGMPGHLWQGATLAMQTHRPMVRRLREGFAAYSEGWGLYSEQLADELGIYSADPLGRIGYLQSLLYRAARIVVDTGMHSKRWSRDQAAEYFISRTGLPRERAISEINRYAVSPGNACSYKVGHNEWVRLREIARAAGGSRFDIRRFHDLLTYGSMPLEVLEDLVHSTDWTG